jgi:hypothetical protein
MITRRRTVVALCAPVAAALLAGCAAPAPAPLPADPLAAALARLDGSVRGYVEFVDLRVLASGAGAWSDVRGSGQLASYADRLAEQLRVDVRRADWTVTASAGGPSITLVAGGQDPDAIRAAATGAGWAGSDVLRRDLALDEPVTVQAGALRPTGPDVVVGGSGARVELVDGPGPALAADPVIAALRDCLGSGVAVAGVHRRDGEPVFAAGIRPAPGAPTGTVSTVCAAHPTADAAAGRAAAFRAETASGAPAPWGGALVDPQVEQLGGAANVVRLTGRNAAERPPVFLVAQMARRDLPGGLG